MITPKFQRRLRPQCRTQRRLGLAILFAAATLGCTDQREEAVAKAELGPVPASEQRSGDPQDGYRTVVEGHYITCGMPYTAWRRATRPPESVPTLPERAGRNAELPYYLTAHEDERGVEIVTTNCLFCHGATFNGELIVGLGNPYRNFTEDPRDGVDAIGAYVAGEQRTAVWREWSRAIAAIAPYMMTDTVGVNPAPNLTLALMAYQDPETLEWSEEPLLEPPPARPVPVSVPPWWRMAKKHALFYNAMGRGDHVRFMMMKSLVCTHDVAEAERIDAAFTDVRAFMDALQPPKYPFAIDRALAERGHRLFLQHCAACHGTYGQDPVYPNLVVALDEVGTDANYARVAYQESDRFMDWFNGSWYGELARAQPALGYIAPPLDGVWATAPYLHNGSVPTIKALLDSRGRPTYWLRPLSEPPFDQQALGWEYTELDHGKDGVTDPARRAQVYDTTLPGYSNAGHTFGDDLTEADRGAVLEYLKTL